MSHTTLFKVPVDGEIEDYKEYKNAWGAAAFVWSKLLERYFPGSDEVAFFRDMQPVWDLWKRQDIPVEYRIVLMSTFDNVMVKRHDLSRLADAMDVFVRDLQGKGWSHYTEMANDLRALVEDRTCYAVCWCQTSVSVDVWWVKTGEDEGRMYDISKDTDHWFLFEELEQNR